MDTWRFSRHHSGYDSLFPDNITWNLEDCLYLILSAPLSSRYRMSLPFSPRKRLRQ